MIKQQQRAGVGQYYSGFGNLLSHSPKEKTFVSLAVSKRREDKLRSHF